MRTSPADGRRAGRRAPTVAAVLGLLTVLGGCAAPTVDAAPTPFPASRPTAGPPEAIRVAIVQERLDIARGVVSIRVFNDANEPVEVLSASYDDPRFAVEREWTGDRQIPADSRRDFRVEIPPASCASDAGPTDATATVVFATPEGTEVREYPVDDPFDFVPYYTAAACFAQQVEETATVEVVGVTPRTTAAGDVATIEVEVSVHGDSAVRLDSVSGTVLLQPASGATSWPIQETIAPGESTVFAWDAVPARCDAHALAEDKVGTRFDATFTVLGPEESTGVYTLVSTDTQRGRLYDYVASTCDLG